ncbi:ribonucleoside-triphosphate reductase [Patescibacteria group bacterium]|nr:ribonucleoside-triphosphate reductase [Patescibacteria group bacterium]
MSKAPKRASAKVVALKTKVAVKTKKHLSEKDEVSASPQERYIKLVPKIQKRNGSIVEFDFDRIKNAIHKAMVANGEGSLAEAEMVAHKVVADLVRISKKYRNFMPTVEGVQETVEKEIILSEYVATAKGYILYRDQRARLREQNVTVPEKVKKLIAESKKYFEGNPLGEFVYLRTYARWVEDENRRETWIETVDRYIGFMKKNIGNKLTSKEYKEIREAILKQEVMPSMRLMQFSGKPADRCNACAYNCSFIAPTKFQDFAEILYLSASGCGVGFAVESKNIQALPQIKRQTGKTFPAHTVEDSKEGWADALALGMKSWYGGNDITFDYSELRPAGARLKTMGGKSSGPDPLRELLDFTRTKILSRQGRRLTNLNAHDIICKIGEAIVSGGVRRTAMISLSDIDDDAMRDSKAGQFYIAEPQRSVANNSAVYEEKPSNTEFMDEWMSLMKSGSGERGLFNRGGLNTHLPERRMKVFEEKGYLDADGKIIGPIGTNPCAEIILDSKQFCNLTEVVARSGDSQATLLRKARIATILGTYQSTLVRFNYLSKEWAENCKKERLLGVSITGQWDCSTVRNAEVLKKMKAQTLKTNREYAKRFGVNASTAVTCIKPSGTVSQTINCASGMHARHAPYYIRRVRISSTDSLFKMLKDQGVPYNPEVGQTLEGANTFVFDFPVKSPEGSVYKDDLSALDQLEYWKLVKTNYTEHSPSVTVSVGNDEWIGVANWLYENWDILSGLSFLPRSEHVYQLAPYEEIDEKRYRELVKQFKDVDYSKLITYELHDETEMKKELACVGETCEIE